jgi:hypothetical protein
MKIYIKSILFVLVVMLLSAPLSGVLSSAKLQPPSPHPTPRFKVSWTPEEFQAVLKGNYGKYADISELHRLYSIINQQGCLVPENLLDDFEVIGTTHLQGVYPLIYITSDHYTGKLSQIRIYYYDKDEALAHGAPESVFSDKETFCHYLESFYWQHYCPAYCPISVHPDDDPLASVTDCQMVELPNGKTAHLRTKKEYTGYASEVWFYKNLSFFEGEQMITFQFPSETTTEEILTEIQSLRLLKGDRVIQFKPSILPGNHLLLVACSVGVLVVIFAILAMVFVILKRKEKRALKAATPEITPEPQAPTPQDE